MVRAPICQPTSSFPTLFESLVKVVAEKNDTDKAVKIRNLTRDLNHALSYINLV